MAERQTFVSENSKWLVAPTDDWKFKHLLDKFISELTDNDLHRIKRLFTNIVSVDVRSWSEMFDMLCRNGTIDRNNIIYIQKIAFHLQRHDLHLKTIEYAKERENDILHFEKRTIILSGTDEEEVFVHVRGDTTSYGDLQRLRLTIADILMIDIKYIKLANVQEQNSVLITFILPKMYVEVLQNILIRNEANRFTEPLSSIGVDYININNVRYMIDVDVRDKRVILQSDRLESISKLLDQLSQKDKQIQKMEEEILALTRLLNSYQAIQTHNTSFRGTKRKYQDERESGKINKKLAGDAESNIKSQNENQPTKKIKYEEEINDEQESKYNSANLDKHDFPECDKHLFVNNAEKSKTPINEKILYFCSLNTTVRKLVSELPKGKKYVITPEEINALSLHKKLDRIYPRLM